MDSTLTVVEARERFRAAVSRGFPHDIQTIALGLVFLRTGLDAGGVLGWSTEALNLETGIAATRVGVQRGRLRGWPADAYDNRRWHRARLDPEVLRALCDWTFLSSRIGCSGHTWRHVRHAPTRGWYLGGRVLSTHASELLQQCLGTTPRELQRTFRRWCADAGLPKTRVAVALGRVEGFESEPIGALLPPIFEPRRKGT